MSDPSSSGSIPAASSGLSQSQTPAAVAPASSEAAAAGQLPVAADMATSMSDTPAGDSMGEGISYRLAPSLLREVQGTPYERQGDAPLYRPLRIYTLDPAASRFAGATGVVNVPYEPLRPGPVGARFAVESRDGLSGRPLVPVDLDDPAVLLGLGRSPTPSDPRFHQQMVYAVASLVYATFNQALGRHIVWAFDPNRLPDQRGEDDPVEVAGQRLLLRPHAFEGPNAFYSRERGSIAFGVYRNKATMGRNLPGGLVFTCLSHDIVAHEVTHALLDGLRAHFMVPTNAEVAAFHEGFADLVALWMRFSYQEVVRVALHQSRGVPGQARLLTDLAEQFGHTTGRPSALRTLIADDGTIRRQTKAEAGTEPHALGGVLAAALFEAYSTVYTRKTARFVRLATGGSGILPVGDISPDLLDVLAREASQLAGQFLSVLIRAVDYCPPVDVTFGEFLRALITADYELVPDDNWGYREALIDAFRARGIYPTAVSDLSEEAIRWSSCAAAESPTAREVVALGFRAMRFGDDPSRPAGGEELRRQAQALGEALLHEPLSLLELGLSGPDEPRLRGDRVELPTIHSIRTARRVGPDGQLVFDRVVEITQRRIARRGDEEMPFLGGATLLIGPKGELRYIIAKSVLNERRLEAQWEWSRSSNHWYLDVLLADATRQEKPSEGVWRPKSDLFRHLHLGVL